MVGISVINYQQLGIKYKIEGYNGFGRFYLVSSFMLQRIHLLEHYKSLITGRKPVQYIDLYKNRIYRITTVLYISTIGGLKKVFNLEGHGAPILVWCLQSPIENQIIDNLSYSTPQYIIFPDDECLGDFRFPEFYRTMNDLNPNIRSDNPILEQWNNQIVNINM